jgi:hemoglobin
MAASLPDDTPPARPFDLLGGDAVLHALVERFYGHMEALPASNPLRAMHATDLGPMREKLFDFLSGWLGGPNRYFQRPDAKCMGSAHAPFNIRKEDAEAWLACMEQALADVDAPQDFRALVMPAFRRMAAAMAER